MTKSAGKTGVRAVDTLSDAVPIPLISLDPRRNILAANMEAESVFGLSRQSMVGRALSEVVYYDNPLFELIDKAEIMSGDMTAHGVPITGPTIASGEVHDVRIRPDDLGGFLIVLGRSIGREAVEGGPGVSGFGRILGHEVKNPLAGIYGATQLLLRNARDDQSELLGLIKNETSRIERLVSRLSAFELFSAPRLERINIHSVLDDVVSSESAAFSEQVVLTKDYDPSLPPILGDSDHLHEAFQNLVRNACEAAAGASGGGSVTVRTAYEAGFGILMKGRLEGLRRALRVSVEDNGGGIPIDRQMAVFEMFQSTKSGGRGLGLSIVREIVAAHGGQIKVDSVDRRTRFTVYLPLAKE